jgi:hypothetical protein
MDPLDPNGDLFRIESLKSGMNKFAAAVARRAREDWIPRGPTGMLVRNTRHQPAELDFFGVFAVVTTFGESPSGFNYAKFQDEENLRHASPQPFRDGFAQRAPSGYRRRPGQTRSKRAIDYARGYRVAVASGATFRFKANFFEKAAAEAYEKDFPILFERFLGGR